MEDFERVELSLEIPWLAHFSSRTLQVLRELGVKHTEGVLGCSGKGDFQRNIEPSIETLIIYLASGENITWEITAACPRPTWVVIPKNKI